MQEQNQEERDTPVSMHNDAMNNNSINHQSQKEELYDHILY